MAMKNFDEIVNSLSTSNVWVKDRYGNFQTDSLSLIFKKDGKVYKTNRDGTYRLKLQANSIRLEKKIDVGNKNEWLRVKSDYYKDVKITNRGLIIESLLVCI